MKKHYLIGITTLLLLSTLALIVTSSDTNRLPNLKDQFYAPDCERACWNGIEPGQSTHDDVVTTLEQLEIDYSRVEGFPSDEVAVYEWKTTLSRGDVYSAIGIYNNIVLQVALTIDEWCITSIIQDFGEPSEIYQRDNAYFLLYLEDGLVFVTTEFYQLSYAIELYFVAEDTMPNFQFREQLNWEAERSKFMQPC